MLWEVELQTKDHDPERDRVCEEFDLLTHTHQGAALITRSARGYLLQGDLDRQQAERLLHELLLDPLAETGRLAELNQVRHGSELATVLLKPGVMDPTAQSVLETARDLGIPVTSVRTFRRYFGPQPLTGPQRDVLFRKVLANEAIE